MNKKIFLTLSVAFIALVMFTSCSKEENEAPTISSAVLASDNKTINVTFSEGVYSNSNASGALGASNLTVVANGSVTFTYTVTHIL